ncbi:hypothetical protein [Natronincola ferrireducens]|uniref:Na+/glutamate symporter n=1 Tax=Natronincola ferrireducens TaxID=393762 RepID=A0A1G9D9T2_9FIRM|nr:hypothetical protein [Natronincola ferrireducens]SDK60668.1 Na+/glutamate symporter [Natronincola ferrireducens]
MTAIYAFTIILVIFAIGELCSSKTNAMLSQALVGAILLLFYYWLGFPKTLVTDAGIDKIGSVISGILIAGVGTTIDFKELARQWKTILIAVTSVITGVIGIIIIGGMIIEPEQAIAGAPIFSGSISAVIIMSEHFNANGMQYLAALCSMLLTVQTFVGLPLSTIMMRKASVDFLKDRGNIEQYALIEQYAATAEKTDNIRKKLLNLPPEMSTSVVILAKLGIAATIANVLVGLTNGIIHYMVMSLFMGIILTAIGFLDENSLNKTGCSGLFMVLILAGLFRSFANITPQDVLGMIVPLAVVLGIGSVCTGIMSVMLAKITKVNTYLAIALSLTCMYGFPTTLFISEDVAKAYGKTAEEYTALRNYLVPKIVTAGIATVTIASVIIANYAIKLI